IYSSQSFQPEPSESHHPSQPRSLFPRTPMLNKIITQLETERKKADGEANEKIERLKKLGKE
ncbi:MAG TPA: hypothetical protein VKL21_12310, partial [Candidatus Methanoperedens sp.]|nr:hypothetical protein [Candidatus Methanoperedens sp.]